jgi:hypothetical protein
MAKPESNPLASLENQQGSVLRKSIQSYLQQKLHGRDGMTAWCGAFASLHEVAIELSTTDMLSSKT